MSTRSLSDPLSKRRIGAPGDLVHNVEFTGSAARQAAAPVHKRGGIVECVEPGSPAARFAITAGDVVTAVNGHRLRDVVDYQFHSSGAIVRIDVLTGEHQHRVVEILKDQSQALGIRFTQPTFSPIRECNNHCPFCFIDQLPGEMRSSLYIRDDDYRYSFLYGNFVTLTNLNESDWTRLAEQRLSPLYVSVHATEPAIRRLLLGNKRAPDIRWQLERLFSLGIKVHAQIVVCPGVNDRDHLDRTVDDLAAMHPNVISIGVVPVGLTRTPDEILDGPGASCSRILPSARELNLRTMEGPEAREVVRQVRAWQQRFCERYGVSVVHASDEIYLIAGVGVPAAGAYDGFPQYENGIGMVRDLLDDWSKTRRSLMSRSPMTVGGAASVTVVCGRMVAPTLEPLVEEWGSICGIRADLAPLKNAFFGSRVTVSGLLTGRDVMQNRKRLRGELIVLPEVMLDKTGTRTLDGLSPAELTAALGKPVQFAGVMSQLAHAVGQSGISGTETA